MHDFEKFPSPPFFTSFIKFFQNYNLRFYTGTINFLPISRFARNTLKKGREEIQYK